MNFQLATSMRRRGSHFDGFNGTYSEKKTRESNGIHTGAYPGICRKVNALTRGSSQAQRSGKGNHTDNTWITMDVSPKDRPDREISYEEPQPTAGVSRFLIFFRSAHIGMTMACRLPTGGCPALDAAIASGRTSARPWHVTKAWRSGCRFANCFTCHT